MRSNGCIGYGVRFCTIADENPTTVRPLWRRFLEEMASRRLPVKFFATIRATDIVRDADILPLYREAGLLYVLMGIDSTDAEVLKEIRKGSTTRHDFLACRLLKQHGIYSVLGHIVGLEDDSWAGLGDALKQLRHYDGDYLNAMYVTPHSWTEFGRAAVGRRIVQPDQRRWDYRHQVLEQPNLKPWQLFAGVKWLELRFHLRVRKLRDLLFARSRFTRRQMLWGLFHTGLVWLAEIGEFLSANLRGGRQKRDIQVPSIEASKTN
jgi:anaerobic magnesium-protoporphyrin IX monomethyl ester cyclase